MDAYHEIVKYANETCGFSGNINTIRVDSLKNMELKAGFARQIYNLPDGAQINFRFIP